MNLANPNEIMTLNVVANAERVFPAAAPTKTGVTGVRTCLPITGQNQHTFLNINRTAVPRTEAMEECRVMRTVKRCTSRYGEVSMRTWSIT
jgi:hypothetical protein